MKFLKVGDLVIPVGNCRDEQVGQCVSRNTQTVTKIKKVKYEGTSGQWVQTNTEKEWVDASWFKKVK